MEIDKLDKALLGQLAVNSRLPLTQLSSRIHASREVITYRLQRLEKQGIIRGHIAEIPFERLGFVGAALFLSVKHSKEKEVEAYITSQPYITWVARWTGFWTHGMSVIGNTMDEVDSRVRLITEQFSDAIRDSRFLFHKRTTFSHEKLFGGRLVEPKAIECSVDEIDKIVLSRLAYNAREDAVEIAKHAKVSAVAVAQRIKKLESSGVVRRYGLFIDLAKLGYKQYSVWIQNKHVKERNRLISALLNHPSVHFVFEYSGDLQLEFGIFTEDPYKVREILMEIEEAFPDNRVLEVHTIQDDLISAAPARCIFQ